MIIKYSPLYSLCIPRLFRYPYLSLYLILTGGLLACLCVCFVIHRVHSRIPIIKAIFTHCICSTINPLQRKLLANINLCTFASYTDCRKVMTANTPQEQHTTKSDTQKSRNAKRHFLPFVAYYCYLSQFLHYHSIIFNSLISTHHHHHCHLHKLCHMKFTP